MHAISYPALPSPHFLNLPRPDIVVGGGDAVVDTSTLAAHDFDVDTRTGFMPPDPPPRRLPTDWEPWEALLDRAMASQLQLAATPNITTEQVEKSFSWRSRVKELPTLSITDLVTSEVLLRRAHHVLTFIMHFYVHTLPLTSEIHIPPPIAIPLLRISRHLQLPPIATYSDTVLYNWDLKSPSGDAEEPLAGVFALENLRSQDLFTGTRDEEEFYLASARIELRGVEALELMRDTMDEMFVCDDIAVRRITSYLLRLAQVVEELTGLLLDVRKGCDPDVFYNRVRPWFCGQDSDPEKRPWVFEGIDEHPGLEPPVNLSGPSAGQSTLIHSLDIFLGLDNCTSGTQKTGTPAQADASKDARALLRKMQTYMPRHHRAFLRHLSANTRPVRTLVDAGHPGLVEAYNSAVSAVVGFRDAHIQIATSYIIVPAARARRAKAREQGGTALKGTGGTDLARFLKGVRDKTVDALVSTSSESADPLYLEDDGSV